MLERLSLGRSMQVAPTPAVQAACPPHTACNSRPKQGLARRSLLAIPLLPLLQVGEARADTAAPASQSLDDESNPLIQELLKRTAEKKEERYKERLNDYYRRNYGDYFAFEAGPGSSRTNGLSPETRQKMLDFLEKK